MLRPTEIVFVSRAGAQSMKSIAGFEVEGRDKCGRTYDDCCVCYRPTIFDG
jgi:hypothetical protein